MLTILLKFELNPELQALRDRMLSLSSFSKYVNATNPIKQSYLVMVTKLKQWDM